MKKPELDIALNKVVDFKMKAIDAIIEEVVKPLEVKDNPEDLIGKPYEQWTAQDLNILKGIYGEGDDSKLTNFIFKKAYERVKEMEAEEV